MDAILSLNIPPCYTSSDPSFVNLFVLLAHLPLLLTVQSLALVRLHSQRGVPLPPRHAPGLQYAMDGPAQPISSADGIPVLNEFAQYLQRPDVRRQNFEDKKFYNPQSIKSWMSDNADRLLSDVYSRYASDVYSRYATFVPVEPKDITGLHLVLAVLAHPDIACVHMIHVFKQFFKEDSHLSQEYIAQHYPALLDELEYRGLVLPRKFQRMNYDGVIKEFDRLRWQFCPVSLRLNMDVPISGGLLILPYCYSARVNQGGTATVDSFKVQADLIECAELRNKLQPSLHPHHDYGWVRPPPPSHCPRRSP